jgi:PleD family two-component response regulator
MKYDILIIDDEVANLRLLSAYLKKENYNVRKAKNGEMALTAIAFELPDLILLDIQMPGMDGYELCFHLKRNEDTQNIPIIFISAREDIVDKGLAFELGGVDYITKPFHELEVAIRVKNQLTIALQLRELQELKKNHHANVRA